MSEDRIKRKDLWRQFPNKIKKIKKWLKAAEALDLIVTQPKGGSSHYAIRFKDYDKTDVKGLVVVVYEHRSIRKDVNEAVFKAFLDKGFSEDDIWKALDLLNKNMESE